MIDLLYVGMYHLETLARDCQTGDASEDMWKHIMQIHLDHFRDISLWDDQYEEMFETCDLDIIWNAHFARRVLRSIKLEKLYENRN